MSADGRDDGWGEGGKDVRFGHDLLRVQNENGIDLLLLKQDLTLSVEERLLALEDLIRFADEVRVK